MSTTDNAEVFLCKCILIDSILLGVLSYSSMKSSYVQHWGESVTLLSCSFDMEQMVKQWNIVLGSIAFAV